MKRVVPIIVLIVFLLGLCSCSEAEASWQEHYELGVRYLSEAKYEEAIIEFSAAIEIDPQKPEAYVSRADAYMASGETVENITAAKQDYETAIEKGSTDAEAYVVLSEIYVEQGEPELAEELLESGETIIEENNDMADRLHAIQQAITAARANQYMQNPPENNVQETMPPAEIPSEEVTQGNDIIEETLLEEPIQDPVPEENPIEDAEPEDKNEAGPEAENEVHTERYDYDDGTYVVYEYDANWNLLSMVCYRADGSVDYSERNEYSADGLRTYHEYTSSEYTYTEEYSDGNWLQKTNWTDGTREVREYSDEWNLLNMVYYRADGSVDYSERNEYSADGLRTYHEYISSDYTYTEVYTGSGWRVETHWSNGEWEVREYDSDWYQLRYVYYNADGSIAWSE